MKYFVTKIMDSAAGEIIASVPQIGERTFEHDNIENGELR